MLLSDLKQALRVIIKNPGYSVVAIVVLALGIGANTAIFSVVNGVLLRALPYPQADRIIKVWHVPPQESFPGIPIFAVSAANYLDWRAQNTVFDKMAIMEYRIYNLTGTDHPEQVLATGVSSDFFSVLQVQPLLGRVFSPDEDQAGHGNVVVLSYAYWQAHFGGNPAVVGQQMDLDGQKFLIAGVMPEKVRTPGYAQLWAPMAWTDQERAVRAEHHYEVIARLRPGVDIKQAQAEMNTISKRLQQEYPADDKGWGAIVRPYREDLVGDVRPALLVMLGAVAFVLLIACGNVANLVLAKIMGRRKEIAIRTALGARRSHVLGHVLSETMLLALIAGALGLIIAHFGTQLITTVLADRLPKLAEIGLSLPVLGFTLGISIFTGVLAGLLPAVRMSKGNVNETLKQGLGRTDTDAGSERTRSALVVVEVALTLMLLIGAGLMIRSLWILRRMDAGFNAQNVLTMQVSIPKTKFANPAEEGNFFNSVLERVRGLPEIQAAGIVDDLPLMGGSHQPFSIQGRPVLPMAEQPEVDVRVISPGYLRAIGIPVIRGRDISESDIAGHPGVALISESMAKHFWPNEDPIGKRLTLTFTPDVVREVIGVVRDVKQDGLDQQRAPDSLYDAFAQVTPETTGGWKSIPMMLVVRTSSDPANVTSSIAQAVHAIDREIPLLKVATMETVVSDSLTPQRLNMQLLATFAGLALLLAAVGTYSVLSYNVRRRVREIGIRMALGAQVRDVLRLIVMQGMRPTLIGVGIGLAGALALNRVLANLVFGVKPVDPLTFLSVPVLLASVGLCASVIPAYRASRIEPMKTLRDE